MFYKRIVFVLITVAILGGCSMWRGGALTANEQKVVPPAKTEAVAPMSFDVKNAESMIIVFIVAPEILKDLAPAPLVPTPYNIMYISVSRTPGDAGFNHSMELGVSVTHNGKMFNYPVYSMVDNKMMSEGGRAITGSPTRMGQITLERKDKNVTAIVAREGKILFKATMVLTEPGEPLDSMPVVSLKMIPGATKDAPPAVKQLISGKFENVKVHELLDGESDMTFDHSLTDGFPKVSIQQVYRGVYRKADFTITGTGVLHDYLKAN